MVHIGHDWSEVGGKAKELSKGLGEEHAWGPGGKADPELCGDEGHGGGTVALLLDFTPSPTGLYG